MGESLGGAVAVDLAAHDGARALVLESTFSSLSDVAGYHYPWLPVRWAMHTRFDSAGQIGRYHGPLLQSHGDADTIVPLRFGRRLFEAAAEPKQFLLLHGHDHNDPMPPQFYDAMAALVDRLPPPSSPQTGTVILGAWPSCQPPKWRFRHPPTSFADASAAECRCL